MKRSGIKFRPVVGSNTIWQDPEGIQKPRYFEPTDRMPNMNPYRFLSAIIDDRERFKLPVSALSPWS